MSKTALGLDIGSRSIEAVWLDEQGRIIRYKIADSTHDPIAVARELIAHDDYDVMCATGYGRHTARDAFDCNIITEIKAYAVGAHSVFPEARSILDIGGQDTKVISLDENGRIVDFEMNDKCAAGTGKFLEVMARALGTRSRSSWRPPKAQIRVSPSQACAPFLPKAKLQALYTAEKIGQQLREDLLSQSRNASSHRYAEWEQLLPLRLLVAWQKTPLSPR